MPPSLKAVAGCFSWSKYDGPARRHLCPMGLRRDAAEDDLRNQPVDGDEDRTLLRQASRDHRTNTPLASLWRGMPYRDSWSDLVGTRFWAEGQLCTYRAALARLGVASTSLAAGRTTSGAKAWWPWPTSQTTRSTSSGPGNTAAIRALTCWWRRTRFFDHWLKGIANGVMQEPATPIRDAGHGWGRALVSVQPMAAGGHASRGAATARRRPWRDSALVAASAKQPRAASVSLSVAAPSPARPAGRRWRPRACRVTTAFALRRPGADPRHRADRQPPGAAALGLVHRARPARLRLPPKTWTPKAAPPGHRRPAQGQPACRQDAAL